LDKHRVLKLRKTSLVFTLFLFLFLLSVFQIAKAETNITDCAELNITGETYYLTADITDSNASSCMNMTTADSIVLDCLGHTIDSDGSGQNGIFVSGGRSGITARNCIITDWITHGVYDISSSYSNYQNLSLSNEIIGMELRLCTNCIISDSTANSLSEGIYIYHGNNVTMNRNSIDNTDYGIAVSGTSEIFIDNNTLSNEVSCSGGFMHLTLDHSIISNNRLSNMCIGTHLNGEDNIIANNSYQTISLEAMRIESGDNNTIANNTIDDTSYIGILVTSTSTSNNSIVGNIMTNVGDTGLEISDSQYNTVSGNILRGDNYAISIDSISDQFNIVYNNMMNGTAHADNINYWNTTKSVGTNIFNPSIGFIGGNYYTDATITGFSDTCLDYYLNGFCYTNYTIDANNIDYLPYSDEFGKTNLTDCAVISNSGTYYLKTNLDYGTFFPVEPNPCFYINASNVMFDCEGKSIIASYSSYGIRINRTSNVTIQRCSFSSFAGQYFNYSNDSAIIDVYSSTNGTIQNITATTGIVAPVIRFENATDYTIRYASIFGGGAFTFSENLGIFLRNSSSISIRNSRINNFLNGIKIVGSSFISFFNNIMSANKLTINLTDSHDAVFYNNRFMNSTLSNPNQTYIYVSNSYNYYFNTTRQNGTRITNSSLYPPTFTSGVVGGNFWFNASTNKGYPVSCLSDKDRICNPFTIDGITDYLPLRNACNATFVLISNTTQCVNSTHYITNTTYSDTNICEFPFSNYTVSSCSEGQCEAGVCVLPPSFRSTFPIGILLFSLLIPIVLYFGAKRFLIDEAPKGINANTLVYYLTVFAVLITFATALVLVFQAL
jgi:parallel beta-helix repeat protein